VATLRLASKRPWAIDTKYFTRAEKPIYLVGMAVHPEAQGKGVGRRLMGEAACAEIRFGNLYTAQWLAHAKAAVGQA